MLKILGQVVTSINVPTFENLAASVIAEYPGFYAINMVSPSGIIKKVFPFEQNRAALGQNLLQHPKVRDYLIAARDEKAPRMSHHLMTYQNVAAFTLYVPLFNDQGQFKGWLNAVLDFNSRLGHFISQNTLEHTRIVVRWDHPESTAVDRGVQTVEPAFQHAHQVLNQSVLVGVGFSQSEADLGHSRYFAITMTIGAGLLTLALILIVVLNRSKIHLMATNRRLALKNSLLSSLSHDISSPLSSLLLGLDGFLNSGKVPSPEIRPRIQAALDSMVSMLTRAKQIHAHDLEVSNLVNGPVNLGLAVSSTIDLVAPLAQFKGIKFSVSPGQADLLVKAEASTLQANVLANVLGNAIKFSPQDALFKVSTISKGTEAHLLIEDQGPGLNSDQLSSFHKSGTIPSTFGSLGERGTGLGLPQISVFMNQYEGRLEVENINSGGCRLTLIFQKVN